MSKIITRKPSWQYDDLAQKIQVEPRRTVAKLVLRHLGSKANDAGESRHGYKSIAAHCSVRQSKISSALIYLRDVLKVVTWIRGTGGPKAQDTSDYQLNLKVMQTLVKTQGVFDPETGKLIRVVSPKGTGVVSPEGIGLERESKPLKEHDQPQSYPLRSSVLSPKGSVTPNEPPERANPQQSGKSKNGSLSDKDFEMKHGRLVLKQEGVR